jgi:leucyl aminopeptidase
MLPCFATADVDARPLWAVSKSRYPAWLERQARPVKSWLEGSGFEAKPGSTTLLPGADGGPAAALVVLSEPAEPWDVAAAYSRLASGDWRLAPFEADLDLGQAALGWALASYRFDRYRKRESKALRLAVDENGSTLRAARIAGAVHLARDLINAPAADLGPAELAEAIRSVAERSAPAARRSSARIWSRRTIRRSSR